MSESNKSKGTFGQTGTFAPQDFSHAWAQQPGEPSKAYELFLKYLQMPRRSLSALSKQISGRPKPSDNLIKLSDHFRWKERAELWDTHRLALRREVMERRDKRAALAERDAVVDLMLAAATMMKRTLKDIQKDKDKRFGPRDLREYMTSAIQLRRLLREQPMSITGHTQIASKVRDELRSKIEQMHEDVRKASKPKGHKDEGAPLTC